ncbi:MAG: HD domain-containing protein, partial [Halobacteriovoraceae bacterium]|nr:HD domain-containing protein [Halobacteriovoraceae bacterium]
LFEHKFFAVVISLETTDHSAVQVLNYIKSNCPNLKIILTLEKESLEKREELDCGKLKKMGVNSFLTKPFDKQALRDVLENQQSIHDLLDTANKRGKKEEVEDEALSDDDLTSISIHEFYSSKAVLFDVFIKLSEDKFVKILHSGDTFSSERIEFYKVEKKLDYLYFKNKDRMKYIKFNNYMVKGLLKSKKIGVKEKSAMLREAAVKLMDIAYSDGIKPQILDQGKEICTNVLGIIDNHKNLHKLLRKHELFDPDAYSHSYLVTLFASSLIKQLEWQSESMIDMMALAAMFHDIGKSEMNEFLISKRPEDMDNARLAEYKTHPEVAIRILEGNKVINDNIKQIIFQHHEAWDGSGFPKGIKGRKIMLMANAIRLIDDFVHVIKSEELPPVDALRFIISDRDGVKKYHSDLIEGFIKIFIDPKSLRKSA